MATILDDRLDDVYVGSIGKVDSAEVVFSVEAANSKDNINFNVACTVSPENIDVVNNSEQSQLDVIDYISMKTELSFISRVAQSPVLFGKIDNDCFVPLNQLGIMGAGRKLMKQFNDDSYEHGGIVLSTIPRHIGQIYAMDLSPYREYAEANEDDLALKPTGRQLRLVQKYKRETMVDSGEKN